MKFFKCLSQNVSVLPDPEESAMKRFSKLSSKLKKKKRSCANEKGTPTPLPKKLLARFAIDENNQPRPGETPLVEDTKSGVDNPVDPAYPGIHNTSWGSDFESYLPEYCVQFHVYDDLDKTDTVHDSVCQLSVEESDQREFNMEEYLAKQAYCKEVSLLNHRLPVEEPDQTPFKMEKYVEKYLANMADCNKVSLLNCKLPVEESGQTKFKIDNYFSSLADCNNVSLLNCESDESIISFCTIFDTDGSHFTDRSLTPSNRSLLTRSTTDGPRILERFPEDILNNRSIFHQSHSDDMSQLPINDDHSDLPETRSLVDHNLCDGSQTLNVQWSPSGSQTSGSTDIDVEGLHEKPTSIRSGHLDPVVNSPDRLFKVVCQSSEAIADDLKHTAINRLMSLETDYINFMQHGIEKFSWPLRHCILSSQQHRTLFQNIEKLVAISEHHVNQMRDENASINLGEGRDDSQCSTHTLFQYLAGLAYESKIHLLVQAYETYAQGFEQSYSLMKDVRKSREFSAFLEQVQKDGSDHFSISDFIKKPILHIQELYKIFQQIHAATSPQSADYQSLQMIKDQLTKCARIVVKLCCARQDATASQNNLACQSAKRGWPTFPGQTKPHPPGKRLEKQQHYWV